MSRRSGGRLFFTFRSLELALLDHAAKLFLGRFLVLSVGSVRAKHLLVVDREALELDNP